MVSIPKLKGWPNQELFLKFCGKHVPFQSCETDFSNCHESVLAFLKANEQMIDISCAEIGEVFHGNPSRREKVDMKASDFVDAWMLARAGQPHWSLSTGLNLYLSQHGLPKVGEHSSTFCCPTPAIIMESNIVIEQMNLWMNIFPASTTLHYDANNNILVVLEGQKNVTLFSPSATQFLKPAAAHNEYPNHSALTPEEADQLVDSLRTEATETTDCLAYSVTLSAGDALFIPEGWWHQVRSQKCTMALNFWFHSDLRPLLVLPSEVESSDGTMAGVDMSSYLLRASLRKAVAVVPTGVQHPQQWTELLLSLSPAAADQLLSYWDTLEVDGTAEGEEVSDEKFFHDIFSPCGDAVPEVRQYLIAQKDKNNEIYAMQVLRNILGTEERDMV